MAKSVLVKKKKQLVNALHRNLKWVSTFFQSILYIDAKLAKIYYIPQGYWKGIVAVKKLANAAKVSPETAKQWLVKQALWQVYLLPQRHIPRPKFDVFMFCPTTPWAEGAGARHTNMH